jgi:hypothetical protein
VNVTKRRFSFDFEAGAIITGDQLEIATEDGSDLELVAGHNFPDGRWYCHVDQAGGIRLYDLFADALNGEETDALPLVEPTVSKTILARTRNSLYRSVAEIRSYEMTTSRDAVDLTELGSEFRTNYASGLISGQGSLTCFWNYEQVRCEAEDCGDKPPEFANYLAQLVLRLQQGASFDGRFYLTGPWETRYGRQNPESVDDQVWWESLCIVTNVAMSFTPGEPILSQIEFVCSGPISLKIGTPPGYILQEDNDRILLEDGEGALELENG